MKKTSIGKERILDAIESGDWKSIKPKKSELERYTKIAKNTKLEQLNALCNRSENKGKIYKSKKGAMAHLKRMHTHC